MAKIIAVPAGFSTHLKITFLCLCLLVITTCKENYVNRSQATGCPLWHIRNKNGQCECGADYYQTVKCDKSYVYIQHGNCITWNNSTNSAVLYTCLPGTPHKTHIAFQTMFPARSLMKLLVKIATGKVNTVESVLMAMDLQCFLMALLALSVPSVGTCGY